jgi:hypothetical protein
MKKAGVPDVFTYNILIAAYAHGGKWEVRWLPHSAS